VAVADLMRVLDGHEVQHLANPVGGHEAGDQDGRIREVQLPGDVVLALGTDAEAPTLVVVEQRGEHTRRVEARATEPVDAAVGRHQRRRLQISDQSMLGNRRITVHAVPPRWPGYLARIDAEQRDVRP
jgi:hypothetical protein